MNNKETPVCAICGNHEYLIPVELLHFHRVCFAHKEYCGYFQLDAVKVLLGYLKGLPAANCAICDKQLSTEELNSIRSNDFSKTCKEHKWMSSFFYLSNFRQQYKDGLPFIHRNLTYSSQFPAGIKTGE